MREACATIAMFLGSGRFTAAIENTARAFRLFLTKKMLCAERVAGLSERPRSCLKISGSLRNILRQIHYGSRRRRRQSRENFWLRRVLFLTLNLNYIWASKAFGGFFVCVEDLI